MYNSEKEGGEAVGVEFELKYRASEESLALLEQDVAGQKQLFQMETVYYDTPTGALAARMCTLRRRMENGTAVCTLKFPAGEEGRGEYEVECEDILRAVPVLSTQSGLGELETLTREGLVPVCGARFDRTAITLSWQEATLELALDRGVLTGGSRQLPLFEAEVELKAGSRQAAQSYGAFLAAAYGLTPEYHSKFRRALALAKGE